MFCFVLRILLVILMMLFLVRKSVSKESRFSEKERGGKREVNNNVRQSSGYGIDLSTMRKEVFQPKEVFSSHLCLCFVGLMFSLSVSLLDDMPVWNQVESPTKLCCWRYFGRHSGRHCGRYYWRHCGFNCAVQNSGCIPELRFCRVVMPDLSTTVVSTGTNSAIRSVIGNLCEKRSMSIASVEIFLAGSDTVSDGRATEHLLARFMCGDCV